MDRQTCLKAEKTVAAISSLMPNIGGAASGKRAVLVEVINSTLLYAAPVWVEGLRVKRYKSHILSVQRKIALIVT